MSFSAQTGIQPYQKTAEIAEIVEKPQKKLLPCSRRSPDRARYLTAGLRILICHREPLLRGDLVFSIRAVDWRLPRRFAPTLYASSRNE